MSQDVFRHAMLPNENKIYEGINISCRGSFFYFKFIISKFHLDIILIQ